MTSTSPSNTQTISSVGPTNVDSDAASSSSSSSVSEASESMLDRAQTHNRRSSGSIIIPRDSPNVEIGDEEYDEGDARTMSPRRSSAEIEKLGRDARQNLIDQAKTLQASLLEICDRVESVKSEHSKLEGENRFLQNYIGELMQTTKITASGAAKGKGKVRAK